jgi:ABC-type branched-subunit amino acid transport system permease subunit
MTAYWVSILTNVVIFAVLTLGLDVQWGWAGLLDLTFFTFVAAGAYFTAVLTMPTASPAAGQKYILGLGLPWGVGAVLAVVMTAALAAVIGGIALKRLRPDYLAIVTLSIGLVIFQLVSQVRGLFNGQVGLFSVPAPLSTSASISPNSYPNFLLVFCIVILVGALLVARRLHSSHFGLSVRAVRDSLPAAQAFGFNTYLVQLKAFVVGAVFAAAGGALLSAYLTAFNPGAWTPTETFLLFVAVLIGGRGRPIGVLLGVALITGGLQEATRYLPTVPGHPDLIASLRLLIIGLLMIVALRFRPQGVLPERSWIDRGSDTPNRWRPWRRTRVRQPAA